MDFDGYKFCGTIDRIFMKLYGQKNYAGVYAAFFLSERQAIALLSEESQHTRRKKIA